MDSDHDGAWLYKNEDVVQHLHAQDKANQNKTEKPTWLYTSASGTALIQPNKAASMYAASSSSGMTTGGCSAAFLLDFIAVFLSVGFRFRGRLDDTLL
jgi:hypothetical protein